MTCRCRKKVTEHTPRCQAEHGTVTLTQTEADALRDLLEYVRRGWVGPHAKTLDMIRRKVPR